MYIAVLDHMKEAMGETFIMSTGDTWSIEDMARHVQGLMLKHTGHEVTLHFASEPDRPLDIPVLQGSSAKARRLLGWEPEYTIAEAIEQAFIEWQEVIGG
jgi:UDP-glucose 4-epimerase